MPPKGAKTRTTFTATTQAECYYEYRRRTWRDQVKLGSFRIEDPDDPRWDGELQQPPYITGAFGYLVDAFITRDDEGNILKEDLVTGGVMHPNVAREKMREFYRRRDVEGVETPWDRDHHYRDQIAEAKAARSSGNEEGIAALAAELRHLRTADEATTTGAGT